MRTFWLSSIAIYLLLPTEARAQELLWTLQTDGAVFSSPTIADGVLFVGSSDGHLYALEAATGQRRWRFATGGAVDSSPAHADGAVYALSRDGFLYAVDARTGTILWRFETGGERRYDHWDFFLSDPLVHGDLVLFGSGDGHLYALDRPTGQLRWKVDTGDIVHAAPVSWEGTVFIGGFNGWFYAIDAETGETKWRFKTVGDTYFPKGEVQRAAAVHDGIAYFGSRDYNIYAIDARKGTGRWNMRDPRGWITPQPLVHDGMIYFGSSTPHTIFAMDRSEGTVRWKVPIQARAYGTAALAANTLLFGAFNGKLYALDPETGSERWTFQTETSAKNFATVYDEQGEFSAEFSALYANGKWEEAEARILALGSIPGTPVVHENRVFFGSTDGKIYAVRIPEP